MTKLIIRRNVGYANLLRFYKLKIDGQEVGLIGSGEERYFELTLGHHQIQAKIDWCSSPKLDLDITDENEEIRLCVSNRNPLSSALCAIFVWGRYLRLEREEIGK